MSRIAATLPSETPPRSTRRRGRTVIVLIVLLALVAAGGWWARQNGLLNRLPGQSTTAAATTNSTAATAGRTSQLSQHSTQLQGSTTQAQTTAGEAASSGAAAASGAAMPGNPPSGAPPAFPPAGAPPMPPGAQAVAGAPAVTAAAPATERVTLPAIAGVDGSQLWSSDGSLVTILDTGATVQATGRSADGAWLAVGTNLGSGWIRADQVVAYGVQYLPETTVPAALLAAAAQAAPVSVASAAAPVTTANSADAIAAKTAPAEKAATAPVELTATVATTGSRLNIRSGPGAGYAVVAKADPGAKYAVTGRNQAGDWLQIQLKESGGSSGTGSGWVTAAFVQLDGDAQALPVVEVKTEAAAAAAASVVSAPAVQAASAAIPAGTAATAANDADAKAATAQSAAAGSVTGLAGTLVFQQKPGGGIYAYNLATGKTWHLTDGFDPAISPDGKTVAFVRDGGQQGLYLINSDGSNERKIFDERGQLSSPKWSTDGQWILINRADESIECYQMGPDQCLTPDQYEKFIKKLPKGANPPKPPLIKEYQHQLSVVDANGNNFHDVGSLNSAKAPDWADGNIVYQSAAGLQRTTDTANGATAANQLIAFDMLKPYYYDPAWQPGGSQIAFMLKGATQWEIYVVNSDGSGMHALTRPVTSLVKQIPSNVAPAYSPDGKHIVYLSDRGADNSAGDWKIWVMDVDGSNQRALPIDVPIDYTFGDEQAVSWGP